MQRSIDVFIAGLAVAASVSLASAAPQTFGKPLEGLPEAKLADVLKSPTDGQKVRLSGTIGAVCRNKGCWLALKQGDASVHVTFEGYTFFVPRDSAGRKVTLEGRVKVRERGTDEVEHLQKEGAGKDAAAAVSVEARGVEIE